MKRSIQKGSQTITSRQLASQATTAGEKYKDTKIRE
jgi:hypothetical protein